MSQLTLRDIASNEEIIVPPEGFVFGRAGGDADIQLDDNTISRRQARVSNRQGTWVLEVMVVPPGQRIPRPQALQEGQTFFIGQSEFEVLAVEDAEAEAEPETAPPPKSAPRKPAPAPAPAASARPAARKDTPANKTVPAQPAQKRSAPPRQAAPVEEEDDGGGGDEAAADAGGDGGGAQGIKALFVGVPKGIAYYLVNVPKLLVNPMGTVRKAIEELPTEPLGPTGLIGYALPAMLATALLGSIAGGIALLIGGHGFSLMAFIPIVPVISAVIGAVITGFIFHPVVGWLVKILKGESDERSRSNYFLQMMTVSIVTAVPSALGLILGALPIPFINLLGPLLTTLTTLVTLFLVYQWWITCFKVVDWFRYVLLVLGALAVIGSAIGLVTGVIATIRGFGSGSASVGHVSGDADEAIKEAERLQKEALANADSATKDALAQAEKATKEAAARAKVAGAAGAKAAAKEAAEAARAADEAAAKDAAKPSPAEEPSEGAPVKPPPPPREDAAPTGAYAVFARKLEAVEKKLEADPTLLRSMDIQRLYGDYLEIAYKNDHAFQKELGRHPEREKLYRLQRNDQVFTEAGSIIDKLANKLGVR